MRQANDAPKVCDPSLFQLKRIRCCDAASCARAESSHVAPRKNQRVAFFPDLDSSSGVVYGPSALAVADIAWGKTWRSAGEGTAFIRNAHDAQADGLTQVPYKLNRTS
jgi:hypothetical protein